MIRKYSKNKIEVKNRPLFFAVLLLMKDKIKQFLNEEGYVKFYKNNVYLKDEFDNLSQDKNRAGEDYIIQ